MHIVRVLHPRKANDLLNMIQIPNLSWEVQTKLFGKDTFQMILSWFVNQIFTRNLVIRLGMSVVEWAGGHQTLVYVMITSFI